MRGTWLLMRRAINEVIRVPGAAIPGIAAPTLFMLGLTAVFGKLTLLPGFSTSDFMAFILPISVMQSATFSGAATGVNLARDIEQGWFDRLYVSPLSRGALLAGHVFSASLRALMPITVVVTIAVIFGVSIQGPDALLLAVLLAASFAATIACYSTILALHFRTQQAAPLMQAGAFMLVLFTTSYAPLDLLTGWFQEVARYNPVRFIVEGVRQMSVYGVDWTHTWKALAALAMLAVLFGTLAMRGLQRASDPKA
jgi:ABC-type multidrug transport system permease subunit